MPRQINFDRGITLCLNNCGAVAGTGATFTSTAAANTVLASKFGTPLAIQTNAALPATDATTQQVFASLVPNRCCILVFGASYAGMLIMAQGPIIPTNIGNGTTPGGLISDPQWPSFMNDFCPIAYTLVRTAPSAALWVPGVSAWAASGVICSTFQNVSQLPNRPQAT